MDLLHFVIQIFYILLFDRLFIAKFIISMKRVLPYSMLFLDNIVYIDWIGIISNANLDFVKKHGGGGPNNQLYRCKIYKKDSGENR